MVKLTEQQKKIIRKVSIGVGIALLVVMVPLLLINATLIIKSMINPDKVPDLFGYKPFIVLSGSMETEIYTDDIVIVRVVDPLTLKVDDIIAFRDGDAVVTHRIIRLVTNDAEEVTGFITKGDNNNSEDKKTVTLDKVEGIYLTRIAKVGKIAMFMQEPVGIIVIVAVPVVGYFGYEFLRKMNAKKDESDDEAERLAAENKSKEEEIARLRAIVEAQQKTETSAAPSAEPAAPAAEPAAPAEEPPTK